MATLETYRIWENSVKLGLKETGLKVLTGFSWLR
jgi:hypothetical protein